MMPTSSGLDDFCGSQFWDAASFNTSTPDFTKCFQKTVLVWIPCGFIWLVAPFYLYYLKISNKGYIKVTSLHRAKVIASILLILLPFIDLFVAVAKTTTSSIQPVDVVSPIVLAISLMLAFGLIHLERLRGVTSSGIMFIFWLIASLCGAITFRSKILYALNHSDIDTLSYVTFYIYYALVILEMILAAIPDKLPYYSQLSDDPKRCPEQTASFLSHITFWWLNGLIIRGYKRSLEQEDLWSLNPDDRSQVVLNKFSRQWKKEECRAISSAKKKTMVECDHASEEGETMEMNSELDCSDVIISNKASLMKALVKTFGKTMLMAGFLKLINDIIIFVNPQLLSLLITFVSDEDAFLWQGILYAGLLFAFSILESLIIHQYFQLCFVVGMQLRTAIAGTVYCKSLNLTNDARKESTVGEIVNLMSVDAQRFMDLVTYIHMVWSAPLQILVALYFLWQLLGPSVLAGLAAMILLIPINIVIANFSHKFQVKQMVQKDIRIKLMSDILNGIRVLKLYAWELAFQKKVTDIRSKELKILKSTVILNSYMFFFWNCAPILVAVVTFAVYVSVDEKNVLDAETAFVSLALFNILRFPLIMLPHMISSLIQANVSMKRLEKFLKHNELNLKVIDRDTDIGKNSIVVENATVSWELEEDPILHNINLEVPEGSLVAVVGQVGCGKSSLLSALLGDLEKLNGYIRIKNGSIAYVPQQAWIQNDTLQGNILFGNRLINTKYSRVIEACALTTDLDILPGGDLTEIGEKGINLSGGQKARVSLARAVYADASIYLLDDPLSAVDSHVGKHIFDNVLGPNGLLKRKTRILVTHSISFLPQVDQIVVLVDGRITEVGSYNQLLARNQAFAEFLRNYNMDTEEEVDEGDPEVKSISRDGLVGGESDKNLTGHSATNDNVSKPDSLSLSQKNPKNEENKETKLIQKEKAETGRVKLSVFLAYAKSVGISLSVFILVIYVLQNGAGIATNFWLAHWSEQSVNNRTQDRTDFYLGIYGALGLTQGIFSLVATILRSIGGIFASAELYQMALANILLCPMSFFDVTPLGRILNRFSKDIDTIDLKIPEVLGSFLDMLMLVIFSLGVIASSTPYILLVFIVLSILYIFIQRFYVATSRQLQRLESVSRSPIYSHFQESLMGVSTIRAYQAQNRFCEENRAKVDQNQVSYYPNISSNRWLGLRLEFIGSCIVFFSALLSVIAKDSLSPGIVGLSITYAMQMTGCLTWMVRMSSDLETNIVAVERIKEFQEEPTEAPLFIEDQKPPKEWPDKGNLEFKDYSVRYQENLDLVLKGINCHIKSGEKIGIVGRTGAGKSSMALAIFRMIEAAAGSIEIDGRDISKLGLFDLRSKLTIIPQDPVLFAGTIRFNLDPFDKHSDDEVWNALKMAHLYNFVSSLNDGLFFECSEGGENLSVGQRQLVCLARALLRKTQILVLDEATAAVDLETDDLIQATIHTQFADCTVLAIAHRLNTVMDSSRIMVLDTGRIAEFGTPAELLAQGGVFYGMARDAGLAD